MIHERVNSTEFIEFRDMIENEWAKACVKHPKFCDVLTKCESAETMDEMERKYKAVNSKGPFSAENLLLEELVEAMAAYLHGDMGHCLQELAQVGAVVYRMMIFVNNEMEERR